MKPRALLLAGLLLLSAGAALAETRQEGTPFCQLKWKPAPAGKELLVVAEEGQGGPSSLCVYALSGTAKTLLYRDDKIEGRWLAIHTFAQTPQFLVLATTGKQGIQYAILVPEEGRIEKVYAGKSERELEFRYDKKGDHELWTYFFREGWEYRRKFGWTGDELREFSEKKVRKLP
jgi:hypothetical protein